MQKSVLQHADPFSWCGMVFVSLSSICRLLRIGTAQRMQTQAPPLYSRVTNSRMPDEWTSVLLCCKTSCHAALQRAIVLATVWLLFWYCSCRRVCVIRSCSSSVSCASFWLGLRRNTRVREKEGKAGAGWGTTHTHTAPAAWRDWLRCQWWQKARRLRGSTQARSKKGSNPLPSQACSKKEVNSFLGAAKESLHG